MMFSVLRQTDRQTVWRGDKSSGQHLSVTLLRISKIQDSSATNTAAEAIPVLLQYSEGRFHLLSACVRTECENFLKVVSIFRHFVPIQELESTLIELPNIGYDMSSMTLMSYYIKIKSARFQRA